MMSRRCSSVSSRRGNRGVSLVELMVALTIGLLIVMGITGVLVTGSNSRRSGDRSAELQTNGRYALEAIKRDLIHAGYRGLTWAQPTSLGVGTITNECVAGFVVNLGQPVWGANDTNPFSATCIPAANYRGGDVLVIRRVSLAPVTTLATDTIYFRSAYERGQIFKGSTAPAFLTEAPYQDFRLETVVYYISPYTNTPTESPAVPALYRVVLSPGPTMATAELVASGIDNMQVQYSRLTTDGNTRYYDAQDVSATAGSTTTDPNEWDDVNAVRVWLLARSINAEPGYTNTTTYSIGDQSVVVSDGLRRQVFSTVAQIRNNL